MKIQLPTTMGVTTLDIASTAKTTMVIKTKDGEIAKFDVDNVNEVILEDVSSPVCNHPCVDLGLPSGTLWATYNVGASKPEEYGDYFAWGETEAKENFNWETYKWAVARNNDLKSFTKYNLNEDYGKIDRLAVLLPEDDAATANWGKDWRMPTIEELCELCENSYMVWTNDYNGTGVFGVIFYKPKKKRDKGEYISFIDGTYNVTTDVHIFIPASGRRTNKAYNGKGAISCCWTSSLEVSEVECAYFLWCGEEEFIQEDNYDSRYIGFPIRAVRAK